MKGWRQKLPPLDCLVFLEAAMRHRSFTEAAEELYVSQAAVSKRIRQLEDWLGRDLFTRVGRRLEPTEAGLLLAERTGVTLDYLEAALQTVRDPQQETLRIASTTAPAAFWLQPRLREFALSDAACPFELVTTEDLNRLLNVDHDLVLLHGDGRIAGWSTEPLFPEVIVPVCAPGVLKSVKEGEPALRPPLLDYARIAPNWVDWTTWLKRTGHAELLGWPRLKCASYNQSIGRALNGHGIALGTLALLQDEMTAGKLVPLEFNALDTGNAYHLAWPKNKPLSTEAERLKVFLTGVTDRR